MDRFKIFIGLSNEDKNLLLKTGLLMCLVRLLLRILPFNKTQIITKKLAIKPSNAYKANISLERLIWAVQITSTYMPGSNCLTNALTGHILLSRENYPNHLRIGVTKDDKGNFEAHAWLESGNQIIIGESQVDYHTLL